MKGKLNQSDLITYNQSTLQDSEEALVHWFANGFNQGFSSFALQATLLWNEIDSKLGYKILTAYTLISQEVVNILCKTSTLCKI